MADLREDLVRRISSGRQQGWSHARIRRLQEKLDVLDDMILAERIADMHDRVTKPRNQER